MSAMCASVAFRTSFLIKKKNAEFNWNFSKKEIEIIKKVFCFHFINFNATFKYEVYRHQISILLNINSRVLLDYNYTKSLGMKIDGKNIKQNFKGNYENFNCMF
jgi:hypothetical protein